MANHPLSAKRNPSNRPFVICLSIFIASALLLGVCVKLDRHLEKTSGKVVETYSKKTFASRKQSYDQEYFVVNYSAKGKDYTIKTIRRNGFGQEYVPVYYYGDAPGIAWCYRKTDIHIIYCAIFMMLSLVAAGIAWSSLRKAKVAFKAAPARKK
jgi:hypothetical protein